MDTKIRNNLISAALGLTGMAVGAVLTVVLGMAAVFLVGGPNATAHSTAWLVLPLGIVGSVAGLVGGIAVALRIAAKLDHGSDRGTHAK